MSLYSIDSGGRAVVCRSWGCLRSLKAWASSGRLLPVARAATHKQVGGTAPPRMTHKAVDDSRLSGIRGFEQVREVPIMIAVGMDIAQALPRGVLHGRGRPAECTSCPEDKLAPMIRIDKRVAIIQYQWRSARGAPIARAWEQIPRILATASRNCAGFASTWTNQAWLTTSWRDRVGPGPRFLRVALPAYHGS